MEPATSEQDPKKVSQPELVEMLAFNIYLAQKLARNHLDGSPEHDEVIAASAAEHWRNDEEHRSALRKVAVYTLAGLVASTATLTVKKAATLRDNLQQLITIPARPAYKL